MYIKLKIYIQKLMHFSLFLHNNDLIVVNR